MRILTLTITTFFGIGYLPLMPGTFASFAYLLFYLFAPKEFPFYLSLFLISIVFFTGVIFSSRAEKIFEKKDPRPVVIDEVLGQMVSLFLIPSRIEPLLIGFFLFRIFDVLKPFPCFDVQKIKGGWGIMLDDLFAGIWANIFLRIIIAIFTV